MDDKSCSILFFWPFELASILKKLDLEMLAACCKTLSYIQKQLKELVILTVLTTLITNVKKVRNVKDFVFVLLK